MKRKGAQIVVETLLEQNVDMVFGYPGGTVLDIYDALYEAQDRLHHVITAHEQGAAHAADGYARATGKVGVCIATSGPGATNLVTGIATAYLDSIPVVAITGNVACAALGRDSFQEVDIVGVTLPVTKHNFIVKDVTRLADTIREAFQIAQSGRPGPVLVDVTKDVQQALCDYTPYAPVEPLPVKEPDPADLDEAISLIEKAERPYIYFGGGIISSGAEAELMELAEKMDAPLGCSLMGLSAVPNEHPKFLGMQGMHGRFASSKALAESDLILAVGVRFSDRATGNKERYSENKTIIHIDVDAAEINKNITANLGVEGDVKLSLQYLIDHTDAKKLPEWEAKIAKFKAREAELDKEYDHLTPYAIIDEINKYSTKDTVVVTDVGQHQMWAAQRVKLEKPRTFLSSGGLGTMGYGLGAAIGGCMGTGERTVLYTGDGCFGMNLNEMATAVSNQTPIVIVLMNNGVLGMVRQWQNKFYGKRFSNTTLNRKTDYTKLVEAFGATGYTVTTKEELKEAVQKAFEEDGPVLLNCMIDQDEFVLPFTPPGGTIDQMIVERGED